jgi:hypothetical protein
VARTPLPPNEEYVRRLAEVLAVLRHALELVEDTRAMPRQGFERMLRLAYPGNPPGKDYGPDLAAGLHDLRGVGWALMVALGGLHDLATPGGHDLAARITVELAVAADEDNPNESHAAGASG